MPRLASFTGKTSLGFKMFLTAFMWMNKNKKTKARKKTLIPKKKKIIHLQSWSNSHELQKANASVLSKQVHIKRKRKREVVKWTEKKHRSSSPAHVSDHLATVSLPNHTSLSERLWAKTQDKAQALHSKQPWQEKEEENKRDRQRSRENKDAGERWRICQTDTNTIQQQNFL